MSNLPELRLRFFELFLEPLDQPLPALVGRCAGLGPRPLTLEGSPDQARIFC
jgi:hypothetical protein